MLKIITKHIPNTITCLNLLAGSMACLIAIEGNLQFAAILILTASIFDFLDGLSARLLKSYSPIGKELDSLADMVSFGLAPGFIAFGFLKSAILGDASQSIHFTDLSALRITILLSAFIIPIFSAIRLAKFNIDTRQSTSFIGVPTPANAMFWSSLPLVIHFADYPVLEFLTSSPAIIIAAIVITSALLVIEIPMFALKVENLKWHDNKIKYLFLISLLILAVLVQWLVVPLILFNYILFSIIDNILKRKQR